MSVVMIIPLVILGSSLASGGTVLDVVVGQEVVLKCQYSPVLTTGTSKLFWIRTNRAGHDNVAIGEIPFAPGYTVDHLPHKGKYDLRIKKADYDRDNGVYECQMKQGGSGIQLHSSELQLVVLLPPEAPVIHPTTPTVTEGGVASLNCSSRGGSPSPQIYWYRKDSPNKLESFHVEGRTKDEETTAMLSFVPKKEDDGSTYRCTVWNRAMGEGDFLEAATSINVNYFPRVTVGPEKTVRVERGGMVELFCKVDAKPAVKSVRWIREGRSIGQTLKHMIARVNFKDAGPYMCSADNNLGQVGTDVAQLDVLFGPEVILPPLKEADKGEEVVVVCNVKANPTASSIVWIKEGDEDFNQTGKTLRLSGSNTAALNSGTYICTAKNFIHPTGGEKQERDGNGTIAIIVRHAPGVAVITPDGPIGVEGETVRLECGAVPAGYPEPTYRWWKEGRKSIIPSSTKQITIRPARLRDMGKYFCEPSNELGKATVAETTLEIYQKPRIILPLKSLVVKKTGDTGFQLKCEAIAKPKPQVRWFRDGVQIDSSISFLYRVIVLEQQLTNDNKTYQVISMLKFLGPHRKSTVQLMPSDRGHYSCQFKNQIATKETKTMLHIEHAPIVKHRFNKVAADKGDSASIACIMQAYPNVTFNWSKKNHVLRKYNMDVKNLGDDIYEGLLHIPQVDRSAYGEYFCMARNKMGTQQTVIELEEKGKPDKPTNVLARQTSPFSVSLTWDEGFNGGYDDTTFNIDYKKIGGGSQKHVDCGRRTPCNITCLQQFTTYQFKVRSVNIRGASRWTRDISVTTDVDVSKIPQPQEVYLATTSNMAEFAVASYPLPLIAKIELKNDDGIWRAYSRISMDGPYMKTRIDGPVSELRLRFCLKSHEALCGAYGTANIVEELSLKASSLRQPWIIALLAVTGLLASSIFFFLVACFCCRNFKPKKLNKKYIDEPVITPSHSYDYLDSKGVDIVKQIPESPDVIKSQMYGCNQPFMIQEEQQYYYDDYTNSSTLPKHMQQYHYDDYSQSNTNFQKQQYQFGYEDYSQYQHLEQEYMKGQTRSYFANGDRYALPNKPRQRLGLDYNPCGEDSGMPEQYSVQNINEGLGSNQEVASHAGVSVHSNTALSINSNTALSIQSNTGVSIHSNAEVSFTSNRGVSLHNGSSFLDGVPPPEGSSTVHSTPSKRIIREIIV